MSLCEVKAGDKFKATQDVHDSWDSKLLVRKDETVKVVKIIPPDFSQRDWYSVELLSEKGQTLFAGETVFRELFTFA